jgi:thiamine biosynthesis lipoprotein
VLNPKSEYRNSKQTPNSKLSTLKLIGIWCLVIGICGCQGQQLYKASRIMMGTTVEVISPDKRASGIVFSEIKRIEDLLSKYKPDSEVSRLNTTGRLKASADTFYVINKAKEFYKASAGAFDITVEPLIELWGFRDKKYRLPKEEEVKKILGRIGSDKIILHSKNNVVEFSLPGVKIDLGAIAKGYAVDCAIKKIKAAGLTSCLINAGGQVHCLGDRFGKPWRVAIQDPRRKYFSGYLDLRNKAVATSGDYEQYFIKEKKRYAHIFNPETGYPAESGVISVTVIAPDGLTADALATAIFVLGKEKGEALVKKFAGVEAKIIEEKKCTK